MIKLGVNAVVAQGRDEFVTPCIDPGPHTVAELTHLHATAPFVRW
jgi:hypothetical protein